MGDALLACLVSLGKLSRVSTLSQLPRTLSTHGLALPSLQGLSEGLRVQACELRALAGAMGEVGDGFQPRLGRKWREMKLEAAFVRAMETVLTSSGPAVYKGTDAPREILVF